MKVNFFTPEWAQTGWTLAAGLDTVDLPSLDPTSTQTRLVSPPAVLLTQQHIHPALCPLGCLPAVPEDRTHTRYNQWNVSAVRWDQLHRSEKHRGGFCWSVTDVMWRGSYTKLAPIFPLIQVKTESQQLWGHFWLQKSSIYSSFSPSSFHQFEINHITFHPASEHHAWFLHVLQYLVIHRVDCPLCLFL